MTFLKNKWEWTTLDKLGNLKTGKPVPKLNEKTIFLFEGGTIPLIGCEEVSKSRLFIRNWNRCYNFSGLKIGKLFLKNTICINQYGVGCGDSALLKNDSCLTNAVHGFKPFEKVSDCKFIKYYFDSPRFKQKISSLSNAVTAQPGLYLNKLSKTRLLVPSHEIQQKIGDILSAYDELIENSDQQIEVLQNIRTSIFKEWFVSLRFPGSNFIAYEPERERERRFPNDWQYQKLEEIANITNGKKYAKMAVPGGKYPFFTSSTKKIERINEYSFEGEAILITNTGSSAINFFRGRFEANNNCFVIFDKKLKNFSILYFLLETIKMNLSSFYKEDSGGIKHLKSKKLSELKTIIPDDKTLEKFNNICENIQLKIENLNKGMEEFEKIKNDLHKKFFSQKITIH